MKKVFHWIIIILLIAGVIGTFVVLWKRQQPKPVQYEQLRVERGNLEKRTIVTGKVEPRDEVAVKAQIQGIIAELYKEAGQPVRKGEAIATPSSSHRKSFPSRSTTSPNCNTPKRLRNCKYLATTSPSSRRV